MNHRPIATVAACAVACTLTAVTAHAAVWQPASGGDWNNPANWNPAVPNAVDAVADFSQAGITTNQTVNLNIAATVGSMVFDGNGGNWTIDNNTLTLEGTATPTIDTINNATIDSNLAGTQGFTKTSNGVLALAGNNAGLSGLVTIDDGRVEIDFNNALWDGGVDVNSGAQLRIDSAGTFDISGPVSGGGTIRVQNTSATLVFDQANPGFTGKAQIQDGAIALSDNPNGGLGSAELEVGYRANIRSTDATARTLSNQIDFGKTNNEVRLGDVAGTTGDLTFTYTGNARGVNVTPSGGGKIRVYDGITATIHANFNDGGVRKFSEGTLILEGNSTTSEDTLVANGGGSLIVNGSLNNSDVTVKTALLGGDGSVQSFLVESGGAIAPGNSVGTFSILNGATFNGGATLQVELLGSTSDRLSVDGALTLDPGALLDVTGLADGSDYIIADYGSLSGTFDSPVLPTNYTIDYAYDDGSSTNNIALVMIPEPASVVLLGLGTLMMLRRRS